MTSDHRLALTAARRGLAPARAERLAAAYRTYHQLPDRPATTAASPPGAWPRSVSP